MAQDLPYSHEEAGVTVLVPDTILFKSTVAMGKYWEPFTDVFGDGTIAIIAGAFPEGKTEGYNSKVAFVAPDGTISEYWAFYADNGTPYTGGFNETRKDGNPPRIAADRRAGGVRYITGQEATPFEYAAFRTDGRWEKDFVYVGNQVAAVQIFEKTATGPKPITKVIDPVFGSGDIEGTQTDQMRFGGDLQFLSNGNVLVVTENRNKSNELFTQQTVTATIFNAETGAIIKGPFNAAADGGAHSIWANVAAFDGGFAVRTEGIISIYDNAGNLKHDAIAQNTWTTVKDTGRGDGVRIGASMKGSTVYILGPNPDGDMALSGLNVLTGQPDKEILANEMELWDAGTFDRGDIALDDNGNLCVAYVFKDINNMALEQIVSRIFDKDLNPLTPTFFAYTQFERPDTPNFMGITSKEVNVSMDNNRIVIAADGQTVDPDTSELTEPEHTFFVVLKNPKSTDVPGWELY